VSTTQVFRAYLVAGLIMSGVWAYNAGAPVWEHAVRFGFLLFVIAPILFELYRRRMRTVAPDEPYIGFFRAMGAKACLLGVALGASALLTPSMGDTADYLVAAGIVVTFALAGPRLHPRLLVERPAVAEALG